MVNSKASLLQSSKNGKSDMNAPCRVVRKPTLVLSVSTGQLQRAWLAMACYGLLWLAYLLRLESLFALSFHAVLEIQDVIRLQPAITAITQHNTTPSMLLRKVVASGAEGMQFAQIVGAIEAELVRRLGSIGTRAARVNKEESHETESPKCSTDCTHKLHTRDVRFAPQLRWPFHELGMDTPDAAHWAQRLFELEVLQPTPVAGDDGHCVLCGLWAVH